LIKLNILKKGQGKVISFKDIEAVRTARTTKDFVKGKGKRGRKRKSNQDEPKLGPEPEPGTEPEVEPETEPEMVCAAKKITKSIGRRALKRTNTTEADIPEPTPEAEPENLTRDIPPTI
jgi:hypothetical protein